MEDDSVEVVDNYELTDDDSDDDGIDYASVRSSDLSDDDDDEDFNTAQRSLDALVNEHCVTNLPPFWHLRWHPQHFLCMLVLLWAHVYILLCIDEIRFSKISEAPSKKESQDSHFIDEKATTIVKPSAIDDFIRNFLLKMVSDRKFIDLSNSQIINLHFAFVFSFVMRPGHVKIPRQL